MYSPNPALRVPTSRVLETTYGIMVPQHPNLEQIFANHANTGPTLGHLPITLPRS